MNKTLKRQIADYVAEILENVPRDNDGNIHDDYIAIAARAAADHFRLSEDDVRSIANLPR